MNKQTYLKIVEEINEHNYRYHALDQPVISDAEYDTLIQQLLTYEKENPLDIVSYSPSCRVGSKVSGNLILL